MANKSMGKRLSALFMAAIAATSVGVFGSCGGEEETREVDESKTQIYISNGDAGIGRTWIEATGAKFEEAFAEYSFENGKVGVQVWYDHNRSDGGTEFFTKIGSSMNNIFFGEGYDYQQLAYGINGNSKLLDLTDVFSKEAVLGYENGALVYEQDKGAIIDKLDDNFAEYLNIGTESDPAYYGMPFYLATKQPIYNVDLWNEKNLYFAKGVAPSEKIVAVLEKENYTDSELATAKQEYTAEVNRLKTSGLVYTVNEKGEYKTDGQTISFGRSAGPDGKYGTDDDGLPATYDEFYLLCDFMAANSITPFIWPGKSMTYADMMTMTLWRNYEGIEQMNNYYHLTGTLDNCVVLDNNGKVTFGEDGEPLTESVTLTNDGRDNGYEGARQLGKYYALQFAEQVATNADWTATECYNSTSQIEAQAHYITYGVTTNDKRIAILCDGAWWQQEAADTFDIVETGTNGKYTLANMRYGVLRLPNATVDKLIDRRGGAKDVVVVANRCFTFANGNIKEGTGAYNATKMFMSFIHSDEMMNLFSEYTNIMRGLEYEIEDETYPKLSAFGRDHINYLNGCDILIPYTSNDFINDNYTAFRDDMEHQNFHSYSESFGEVWQAIEALHDSGKRSQGLTAKTFFEGMHSYYKNIKWSTLDGNTTK